MPQETVILRRVDGGIIVPCEVVLPIITNGNIVNYNYISSVNYL